MLKAIKRLFCRRKKTAMKVCVGVEVKACKDCMKGQTVEEAFATIIDHCKRQPTCEGCCFDEDDVCAFAMNNLPCDWKMPERRC